MIKEKSTQDRSIDLISIGGIRFDEATHSYYNKDNVQYTGITTLLKKYKHEFDSELNSLNSAIKHVITENFGSSKFEELKKTCRNEELTLLGDSITQEEKRHIFGYSFLYKKFDSITGKYPNLKPVIEQKQKDFLSEWKQASLESTELGSLEHDKREQYIKENGFIYKGVHYKYIDGKNILNVTEDDVIVIPECLVWNHKLKICGLADIFLFNKGVIHVLDYKTNESIDFSSFLEKKMKSVCSTLMDCNYIHYSLQLNIYQEIALKLRKGFKKGDNVIIHTSSEKYNRKEDNYIDCYNVNKEVKLIFKDLENDKNKYL